MTEKKENIILAALELFSKDGYNPTPTSKIAQRANVSEGLIFKHFGNKKGLLDAIVKDAEERLKEGLLPIITETDPKEVLRICLTLPFQMDDEAKDFWKLQFKLKWEQGYNNPEKTKPLIDKLTWAFDQMGYDAPATEAELFSKLMDTIMISILRDGQNLDESFGAFILNKYGI